MSVIFTFPYGSPTKVLRLKDPELGDDDVLNVFTRFKVAMDGSNYSYRTTSATRSLSLQFRDLTRRKAMEVRDFLIASAGQEIGYSDYNSVEWRGYLLVEAGELITDGPGPGPSTHRKESTSISLQFEGGQVT